MAENKPEAAAAAAAAASTAAANAAATPEAAAAAPAAAPAEAPAAAAPAPAPDAAAAVAAAAAAAGPEQQQQQQQQQEGVLEEVGDEDACEDESRAIINELERRVALCESAMGLGAYSGETTDGAAYESSVVLSLCRLQHQLTLAMRGSLADIEGKYSELKVWLEGGHLSAARLMLTLQAKRDCVLQQEEQLLAIASQLRLMQSLQEYVNPPALSELEDYKRRVHALEVQGNSLAVHVAGLERKVASLAELYNTSMNMVSSVMEEWHLTLTKAEAASSSEAPSSPSGRISP